MAIEDDKLMELSGNHLPPVTQWPFHDHYNYITGKELCWQRCLEVVKLWYLSYDPQFAHPCHLVNVSSRLCLIAALLTCLQKAFRKRIPDFRHLFGISVVSFLFCENFPWQNAGKTPQKIPDRWRKSGIHFLNAFRRRQKSGICWEGLF